ncbi:Uncharacterised protein [Alloiococcus otitis]|uniref:DUF3168 domain-containing protein n=1 Tax=Alloiococcus otitis ATCC 51267 TaxID=883081 RepID=K9EW17_9LACT|nr:hypothetical protein [Alloiococcus otitis]EKU93365.1 hypothetical protein HMPREF9698_01113 [Alloiococcus otitis ATCC 51267]SUU81582.1 Uncharacterised protein [Alloiococcus otitis]
MTPANAVFRYVFATAQDITDNVYDYLPDASAHYPFIYIGEDESDHQFNTDRVEDVEQTVHLWGKRTDRNQLDYWLEALADKLKHPRLAFAYTLNPLDHAHSTIPDNTTGEPLLHHVLAVRFRVIENKGE